MWDMVQIPTDIPLMIPLERQAEPSNFQQSQFLGFILEAIQSDPNHLGRVTEDSNIWL